MVHLTCPAQHLVMRKNSANGLCHGYQHCHCWACLKTEGLACFSTTMTVISINIVLSLLCDTVCPEAPQICHPLLALVVLAGTAFIDNHTQLYGHHQTMWGRGAASTSQRRGLFHLHKDAYGLAQALSLEGEALCPQIVSSGFSHLFAVCHIPFHCQVMTPLSTLTASRTFTSSLHSPHSTPPLSFTPASI